MNLARQVLVDMNLDLVEALHRQRQAHEPIHSNGAAPVSPEAAGDGAGRVAPHAPLSCVDRYHKTEHTRQHRESAEMPAERSVMTFADNALAKTAPAWYAQAIRLALTASIE